MYVVYVVFTEASRPALADPSDLAGIVIGTLVGIVVTAIVLSFTFSLVRRRCVGVSLSCISIL